MPRVIRNAADLGPGQPVLIYGAGERGAQFARELRNVGTCCAGFLDSFKDGEQEGLPVFRYQGAPEDLLRQCRVVIASHQHVAIANRLSLDGVENFLVLAAGPGEVNAVPLALDVDEALDLLADMPTTLGKRSELPQGVQPSCSALNECLWVGMDGLKYCCFMPDSLYFQPVQGLLEKLKSLRQGLYDRMDQGQKTCCDGCMLLACGGQRPKDYRLNYISFGHNSRCNFKCSYCTTRKNQGAGADGLALDLVRKLDSAGLLHPKVEFSWAGEGEPVLDPDFDEILGLFERQGAAGLVYTNASVHSPLLERALAAGRMHIVTSLDAGTAETFERMHGVDAFDRVVANLKRYRAAGDPDAISLKYILTPDNANAEETRRFIALCGALGIRKVIISSDYSLAENPYAELTSQFRHEAGAAGLEVSLSPWSA